MPLVLLFYFYFMVLPNLFNHAFVWVNTKVHGLINADSAEPTQLALLLSPIKAYIFSESAL